MVVGHLGYVRGDKLYLPWFWQSDALDIWQAVQQNYHVIAGRAGLDESSWRRLGTVDSSFRVLTRIDGKVLRVFGERANANAEAEDITPLDLILIAKAR